jgi:mono/diheme cytochrome c family protein
MKLFILLLFASSAQAATLTINTPNGTKIFSTAELLKKADPAPFTLPAANPAYTQAVKPVAYQIIPFSKLIEGLQLKPDATIKFKCTDGFSSTLPTQALLSTDPKQARAYIAIEDPKKPWPALKTGAKATPGPFYLVWKNPELSKISPEEWPYQIVEFQVAPSLAEQYPAIFPDAKLHEGPVEKGFQVFVKNCFTCHTLNGQGDSKIGPDLNIPYNPTEYFAAGFLQKWIRNPQSLHRWPQSTMPAFNEKTIPADDLENLFAYLKHMASRKVQ